MAREYARVKLTIWTDPDFHSLTGDAQRLYFVLLTNGSLNLCGVTDWREARLSALCSDWDIPTIRNAALELGNADLIAIDPNTEEVLVRSFVRHDGVLKSPNITRAMVKDYGTIASHKLRALVSREVRRGFRENPDWKGASDATQVTKQHPEADSNTFEMVPTWFECGSETVRSETGVPGGEVFESGSNLVPTSHYPLPTPSSKEESEGASRRTGRKRPARPLPDDWTPRDQERRAATAKGIDPDALADDMRNWAQAKDERRVDWDATFRTFISREKPSRNTDPLNRWQQAFNSLAADEYPDHHMIEGAS